ncbi:XrtA/PEP-CTERM system TPR-repeat protein PrsT [Cognaticolwellia mytili]|uniref:XrtA/PEP-CTERM system TPR-repeat protein PrsT n=1 Tax=Cognaticolwellia mytili TaxID=1888913 RepID=UPI000A170970|nr:XrtA/PEP-CTERM system TPR-repeat protein PrsT [Cognaticolwellia mytili]
MNFFRPIIFVSVAIMLSACVNDESAQSYIIKAEKLIAKKQDNAAIISLKNAIKVDTKNAQARFLLGRLYLSTGDAENAEKELERAYRFKYDIDKVMPLLARAYMLTESDADILALQDQEETLSQLSTQYLAYKTMAAVRTGNDKLAQVTVDSALSISDGYSMLANAYLEISKQNTGHARTLVERILEATPNNVDALMLQGQIATVEKNYSLAVDSFKQYQKLQPNYGKVQLFIADSLIKNGQYKEAEKIADAILAKIPNQPFLQYIKAMARFEDKDYQAASNLANQSISAGFNSFSLKLVAGASAYYLKNYKQSYSFLKDLTPHLPVDHSAQRMLALSQLQLGLIDDISETLSDSDEKIKKNAHFLSVLSYELLEAGAYDKAQEMADYAANSSNISAEGTARAGILKLMMNDPSGIEKLELALQQNPELISAELALAFASIKSGDLARASKISNKWLELYPNKAGGYNLQAAIFFKKNKLEKGKVALEKSLQLEPNNAFALTKIVKLAAYQKDVKQAKLLTEQALRSHPNNIEILYQYFEFHKDEAGLKVITKAQQDHMDNVKYGILLADALMQLNQFKQASNVLDSYQLNIKTPKRYWQLVLAANAKQPEGKDVYLILNKWHKNNAYHIEPVFLLANYWASKRSPDRALKILEKSEKIHPSNIMINLLKMQILLRNSRVFDARALLDDLNELDVNDDLMAGIEGRIFLLEKKFAKAIPKLQQLYNVKPTSGNVTFLARALEANNQKPQAIELLERFSNKEKIGKKIDLRVNLSLADMYLSKHKSKAIMVYERLAKAAPNNIVVLNNLSWLYIEQKKFRLALKHSEQAYALNAKMPSVVDTYAYALLKSNKKSEALIKAKEAYELSMKKDVDIALNFVEILLANNNDKDAQGILNDITAVTAAQKEKKLLLSR